MSTLILLVDDELHVSQILGRRLAREGYRIEMARDGVEALEHVRAERPDLIISDLQMPRMDGMALAVALTEEAGMGSVPVILLTARGHRVDQEVVEKTGIVRLMAKPFSSHEMVTVVGEVLENGRLEAA